jgi:hypothetical protein
MKLHEIYVFIKRTSIVWRRKIEWIRGYEFQKTFKPEIEVREQGSPTI